MAILDYLELVHSDVPLLPADPVKRARILELAFTIACDTHPLQNLRTLHTYPEANRSDRAKEVITTGLATFESLLRDATGLCSVGDQVSWADVVLVPQVYNARRWNVDMAQFPKIERICAHLEGLPAFQRAHPEAQPDAIKQ